MLFSPGLNPRFDGAFLNWQVILRLMGGKRLNPRFDGAFLNFKTAHVMASGGGLNPRFDGAFLNFTGCNNKEALLAS